MQKTTSKDIARLMISLVLFLFSAAVFSYLMYRFGPNPMALQNSVTLSQLLMQEEQNLAIESEISEESGDVAGVADTTPQGLSMDPLSQPGSVSDETIDYVRTRTGVALRYRNQVYETQIGYEPQPVVLEQAALLPWSPLISILTNAEPTPAIYSFMATEDTNNAVFVIKRGSEYDVYAYREYGSPQMLRVHTFVQNGEKPRTPKVSHIGTEGNHVALALYTCYECGNEVPETLVINLTNGSFKNIGKTATFSWLTGGAYEYKEYQETDCPGDLENALCAIDPQFLELQTEQI